MNKRKRIADWLEKMSAAFMVGSIIAEHGGFLAFFIGAACLAFSLKLTVRE